MEVAGRRTDWNKQQTVISEQAPNKKQNYDKSQGHKHTQSPIPMWENSEDKNVWCYNTLGKSWKSTSLIWIHIILFNDTMVMDNVYPSLHAIFSNHIFFYPDPKNARCMHNYKQNWWHQDADNVDRSQAWQLENWIHLLPCYAVLVA